MAARPVEFVLVIYYGTSAHRATYGRLPGTLYTKDFIQLSKKPDFTDTMASLFPESASSPGRAPLNYKWPTGEARGEYVYNSSDRPHLSWETHAGAPLPWKMSPVPSDANAQTIPGNPTCDNAPDAETELSLLTSSGAGQPYLVAIKLRDEPATLHIRVYLENPNKAFDWANIKLAPQAIQALATKTSSRSALAWSTIMQSKGTAPTSQINDALSQLIAGKDPASLVDTLDADTGRALATYLQHPADGLFFDPSRNHDAWQQPVQLPGQVKASFDNLLEILEARFPSQQQQGDAAAETLEFSSEEVDAFRKQIERKNYDVDDSHATGKTRGSAQKAFAKEVKTNYGFRCAITNIETNDFLVASHIVPWSEDQTIRLDPSNGICLSLLVDRAFERGHLLIEDDLTILIDWGKVGNDQVLRSQLEPHHGQKLNVPKAEAPKPEYLQRRRALVTSNN
jgi:hypothetical protein